MPRMPIPVDRLITPNYDIVDIYLNLDTHLFSAEYNYTYYTEDSYHSLKTKLESIFMQNTAKILPLKFEITDSDIKAFNRVLAGIEVGLAGWVEIDNRATPIGKLPPDVVLLHFRAVRGDLAQVDVKIPVDVALIDSPKTFEDIKRVNYQIAARGIQNEFYRKSRLGKTT